MEQKMEQNINAEIIKAEIKKLIQEAKFKAEVLPDNYFAEYFKNEFLPEILKYLQKW